MMVSIKLLVGAAALVLLSSGWWWQTRARALPPLASPGWAAPPLPAGPLVVSTLAGRSLPPTYADGPGAQASFRRVGAVAADRHGNLYVADLNAIRRISPAGVVSTLAGEKPRPQVQANGGIVDFATYTQGSADGPGSVAEVKVPGKLAVGPDGAVYFTEENAIRRVSPQGEVTTVAGQPGYGQDSEGYRDGPGRQARFHNPAGLAVGADGTVYVADASNHVIRRISPAGLVSTLAGQARAYGAVNGTGAAARFDSPATLVLAPDGALLVADRNNGCIRRVTPQGVVTTWAGTLRNQPRGANPGADLDLDYLQGLALAPDGTLFFTDGDHRHTIRRLLPDRTEPASPWAGQKDARAFADAAAPGGARFNFPDGLALGPDGTLFVADVQNGVIRAISPGGAVRTLAGQPPGARPLDGQGPAATLVSPTGLALEADGTLLVAGGGRVRRVSPQGAVRSILGQFLEKPGPASPTARPTTSQVVGPVGVAVVGSSVFVTDATFNAVFRFDPPGQLTVWAGQPGTARGEAAGLLTKARLNRPTALAAAPDGTLYVAEADGFAVRRISPRGRMSTLTSHPRPYVSPFSNAGRYVYSPYALAVGPDGAVYVLQGALRRYPPGGNGRAQVLAGSDDNEPGYADGRGAAVRFNYPTGLAVAADGTVYVADRGNHLIRQVSPTGEVTTLAGQPGVHPLALPDLKTPIRYGPDGYPDGMRTQLVGDYVDGPAAAARFNHPAALALGPGGVLYVADEDNNRIRVIQSLPKP